MMPTVEIKISGEALAVIRRIADTPGLLAAVAREMDRQNEYTIGHIQSARLSGPTTEGSLSVRTNRLRSSIRRNAATVTGNSVESTIGTNVKYAGIHEFGGIVHHPARAGSVRLRTDAKGILIRRADGRLAIFAKKTHKRAKQVQFEGKAYDVTYPERAPIRKGIADRAEEYGAAVSQAVIDFWNQG